MPVEYICDGCGKHKAGTPVQNGTILPQFWFSRSDDDGEQYACSRECIEKVYQKTGKTNIVMPI